MSPSLGDRRPRAVVVDDDVLVRMDAADILDEAGFRAHEAEDAEEALAILERHHASVVLLFTDVEMPGSMDGFGLARKVAASWSHIGIMVASGRCVPEAGDLPEGAHFVGKPFSAEVVHGRLKVLLPEHHKPAPLKDGTL